MIKFKDRELSNKEDVLCFMINDQQEKKISNLEKNLFKKVKEISENLFEKKTKLKMYLFSHHFTVRPNKIFKIPIIISNETKTTASNNKIIILSRNNKDLKIVSERIEYDLNARERIEINIQCESNNQLKVYDFEIFMYSTNSKIECQPINIKVEVNNDEEEEELNDYFRMYSKILVITKKEKEMIRHVIKEGISSKHPYIIYNIMSRNNWDIDDSLDELTLSDHSERSPVKI